MFYSDRVNETVTRRGDGSCFLSFGKFVIASEIVFYHLVNSVTENRDSGLWCRAMRGWCGRMAVIGSILRFITC